MTILALSDWFTKIINYNIIKGNPIWRFAVILLVILLSLAIGRIGTASLTRFLPQLLKDEPKMVRIAAAQAVFQCVRKQRAESSLYN